MVAPRRPPPPSVREWLTFALLRDAPRLPGGKYLGIETAPVEPWPHQRVVARRVVESWPYSFLLCDEVGLGKTIEAGLAIRALHLSGYIRRALIAAPAHLTAQWQREMAAKFLLPFARALSGNTVRHVWLLPTPHEAASQSLYEHPLTIVSTGLMPRAARRGDLEHAHGFDTILLDEAQCARRANPTAGTSGHPRYNQLYTLARRVLREKARSMLLVTATPMQLHEVEAADLMRLTRRAGAFLHDPSLTFAYYRLLAKLNRHTHLTHSEWRFLRRAVRDVRTFDPQQWRHIQATAVGLQHRSELDRWITQSDDHAWVPGTEGLRRLLFAAAPLSRTMLRHTRLLLAEYRRHGDASGALARRNLLPVAAIQLTPEERDIYARIERYCGDLAQRVSGSAAVRTAVGFFSSFLQLRFASSLYAIRRTLERRIDKVALARQSIVAGAEPALRWRPPLQAADTRAAAIEAGLLRGRSDTDLAWEQDELQSILEELLQLSAPPSKLLALIAVLQARTDADTRRIRQAVIFTRFVDTLNDLAWRLLEAIPDMRVGVYSGVGCRHRGIDAAGWVSCTREEVNQRFLRGEVDVLLCTDAAAEGVNLQTADLLVNYDLPWNPMKLEQRIGRIDRIGQRNAEVQVLNLCYPDSVEHLVYGRLLERLQDIMGVIGRQNLSLLPVLPREFERLADGTLSFEALEAMVRERLRELERRNALFDIPAAEQYDMYTRIANARDSAPLPASLPEVFRSLIDSSYLRMLGCRLIELADGNIFVIAGVPGVPPATALTTDRKLYERGVAGYSGSLRFATWGEPAFDSLLETVLAHPAPRCVRRLEIPVPGAAATLAAYAVATTRGLELVTSLARLREVAIDETREVGERQVAQLQLQLESLAREEGRNCREADWVETVNEEAGSLQLALHCFAAASLLDETVAGRDTRFKAALARVEDELSERELVRIARIPAELARAGSAMLFDVSRSESTDSHHVDLPGFMLPVLLDAARREADALRADRESLTVDKVIQRLRREGQRALSGLAIEDDAG